MPSEMIGEIAVADKAPKPTDVIDLMDALQRTVEQRPTADGGGKPRRGPQGTEPRRGVDQEDGREEGDRQEPAVAQDGGRARNNKVTSGHAKRYDRWSEARDPV